MALQDAESIPADCRLSIGQWRSLLLRGTRYVTVGSSQYYCSISVSLRRFTDASDVSKQKEGKEERGNSVDWTASWSLFYRRFFSTRVSEFGIFGNSIKIQRRSATICEFLQKQKYQES